MHAGAVRIDRDLRPIFTADPTVGGIAPAYPLKKVVDPTGAGDSFVGGMIGYLASAKGDVEKNFRRAIIHGTVTASFCCEGFGVVATTKATRQAIDTRVKELEQLARF